MKDIVPHLPCWKCYQSQSLLCSPHNWLMSQEMSWCKGKQLLIRKLADQQDGILGFQKKNPSFSPNSHSCHTEEREDMCPLWYQPITQQDCYSSCLLVLIAQSSLTLWDHMDYSPSSYSVQGILQARILEWVTISFSRRPSWPGVKSVLLTWQADSLLPEPPGKPHLSCLPHPYHKNSLVNSKTVNLPS